MHKLKAGITLSLMAAATAAVALPPFVKDFQSTYGPKKGSKLATANCAACHVGMTPKLNVYGGALKKAMAAEKTKKLTGSVLKKVEGLDSDKDSKKNIDEIRAGTLPGDPKSK